MKKKSTAGFTLIEILISLGILVFGVVGIIALFPAGLKSTSKAVEESYASFVADSVYASLRASAAQVAPGDSLVYFHDGIDVGDGTGNSFELPEVGRSIGIPNPQTSVPTEDYGKTTPLANDDFAILGQNNTGFNVQVSGDDQTASLGQYSFNIQISYPPENGQRQQNPDGVFDVMIRIRRGGKLIKRFPSKIFIPTNNRND